jgi:putative hemolysin
MRVVILVVAFAGLAGCNSPHRATLPADALPPSDVTSLGEGTYRVSVQANRSAVAADAWPVAPTAASRAAAYCGKVGKTVEVLSEKTDQTVDWTPQDVAITFKCV